MKASTMWGLAARQRTRAMVLMTLAAAVVLMLHVPALALTQVNLHGPHVGASSETFSVESDDGGLTDAVVWHFILNGLDNGAPSGTIYVTFANAGLKTATGISVGIGKTQHFYVGTGKPDSIVSAYAMVDSVGYQNLVLSHIALNDVTPPPDDEEPPPDDEEPPPDDEEPPPDEEEPPIDDEEPPVDDEEPPVDEETPPVDEDDPPVDEETPPVDEEDPPVDEETPPVDEEAPPVDEETPPVTDDDDPFLPFTPETEVEDEDEAPVTVEKEEAEPFLPYTGADLGLITLLAGASAALGTGLRKFGLR